MLKSMRHFLTHTAGSLPANAPPPAVPLRRNHLPLEKITIGNALVFAEDCPILDLSAQQCPIYQLRKIRFGAEQVKSFLFSIDGVEGYSLAIAEDEDGHYLALSRQLDEAEQDRWFGRDALSFFTEESTAKTIRCKVDPSQENGWAAARYIKSVDWIEGGVLSKQGESLFHYNLLVNETGEKALEIEHDDTTGRNRVYVTVYRPVEDIARIAENVPHIARPKKTPVPVAANNNTAPARHVRPDFRRASEEEIHIPPVDSSSTPGELTPDGPPLPSFLMSRSEQQYISLDEVIPPEPERVRCGIRPAKALLDVALERGVRVRDVLRELLGLESALSEEVIFELPLSDKDYRQLAQRYRVRADAREEIRLRLQEELRSKLLS